jgi:pimeloyl-ACP methyl ester carboxylesterase
MVAEFDLTLSDGRTLHAYDTETGDLAVFWHHGTPQTGASPVPLLAAAERQGIRWVSHDRPGYGGSTRQPGRTIGSVAPDVAAVADALGIERFAALGASGGGPHVLACAALLPERMLAGVSIAGLAPIDAEGLDLYAGMGSSGMAELQAAAAGPEALAAYLPTAEFDPDIFTPADHAALDGPWGWVGKLAQQTMAGGFDGMVDDDVALVTPWGFDVAGITAPMLFVHGGQDRMVPPAHSTWLAGHCRSAELRPRPDDGHISVLAQCESAMEWLRDHAG